jgi:hypothetical protein
MPFLSKKQNSWAHTPAGTEALGGPAKVQEWENATDYSKLPDKAPANKLMGGAVRRSTLDVRKGKLNG